MKDRKIPHKENGNCIRSSLTCAVCKKKGHTHQNCFSHRRSIEILRKFLRKTGKDLPKEINAIIYHDPPAAEQMRTELRNEGSWMDVKDVDKAITCSISIQASECLELGLASESGSSGVSDAEAET